MLVETIALTPTIAILGALLGLGGSAISSALSYKIAKENRQWQERMSNTAYQRGMKDMKLAGLNPILAYQKGGASTPPGAMSTVADPTSSVTTGYMARKQAALIAQQEATSAAQQKMIDQDRKYKLNEQKYESQKAAIKGAALGVVGTSAKTLDIGPWGPDFGNFLDRKNPKGSYIDRGLRDLNKMRKTRNQRGFKSRRGSKK